MIKEIWKIINEDEPYVPYVSAAEKMPEKINSNDKNECESCEVIEGK